MSVPRTVNNALVPSPEPIRMVTHKILMLQIIQEGSKSDLAFVRPKTSLVLKLTSSKVNPQQNNIGIGQKKKIRKGTCRGLAVNSKPQA